MAMTDRERRQFDFENKTLDLIELQLRNDDNSLTQSDLQGAVGALVSRIFAEKKRIVVDHVAYTKRIVQVANAMADMDSNSPEAFEVFLNRMVGLGIIR